MNNLLLGISNGISKALCEGRIRSY